jgi:CubicO group peptidase (beta-lactamase class C family)
MPCNPARYVRFYPTLLVICLLSPGRLTADEPPKALASVLRPYVDRGVLAGAVMLVANKDRVLDTECVGFSDLAGKKPMKSDALFWIASQSKPITATALMMLVDRGKVSVSDAVEKYLPEFKGQMVIAEQDAEHMLLRRASHPITVREILTHTSGLPFSSPMERPTLDQLPLRDAVRSYAMGPLQFEPGTKYQYSNAGINTAGRIIEVVSGMPYEEFLARRLFSPLGMKDTTFWPTEAQLKRLAKSYKPNPTTNGLEQTTITQLQYPLNDRQRRPMPAGGLFSTAHDLARFCQMILNGGELDGKRYLSQAALQEMTSKQTGKDLKEGYGFGWSVGETTCGHGGAYATNMNIDRRRGLILVWLVQHAGFPDDGAKSFDAFREAAFH